MSESEPKAGTLYIVSTPIGNLEDITLRALRILRDVDLIAAEDTRTTRNLLRHYEIETECISCFSRNEQRRIPMLLDRLRTDASIAVVSDAGTPGISDPAAYLISAAIAAGIDVIPIPGPSAVLAALVASGLRMDRFHFEGFLPVKKRRMTRIRELSMESRTIVLYESVHRLLRTLRDLDEVFGARSISVSREISKKFEETIRGSFAEVIAYFESHPPRGEFVLVVAGRDQGRDADEDAEEEERDDGTSS